MKNTFRALESSIQTPNPNRECVAKFESVGKFKMGTLTYTAPDECVGPVTLVNYDSSKSIATIRQPNGKSSEFKVLHDPA